MKGIVNNEVEDDNETRVDHVMREDEATVLREILRFNLVEDGQTQFGQCDVEEVADVDGQRGHGLSIDVREKKILQKVAAFC